ncbi:hypothetical protein ACWEKT_30985 [Nocardia takedensis]
MPESKLDAAKYKADVLIPLRKAHLGDLTNGIAELRRGAQYPSTIDLAMVYAIEPGMDDAAVAGRIREVRAWWNKNKLGGSVKEVAKFCGDLDTALGAKHSDLTTAAFWAKWQARRVEQSRAVLDDLAAMLVHQYRDFGVITLDRIRAAASTNSMTARLSDAELSAMVRSAPDLRLVEEFTPPTLEIPQPVRREWGATTGLRTYLDAVFYEKPPEEFRLLGGFAAPGLRAPTAATIKEALHACDKRAGTEVEAVKKLLHALNEAHGKGEDVTALTLVQLVEVARESLQGGIVLFAIQKLVERGLDRTEAARVVMYCVDASSVQAGGETPQRVLDLLADNQLRSARTLFNGLSTGKTHAGTPELADAERALTKNEEQVTAWRAEAEQALRAGRVAVATELLSRAFAMAADDESLGRLVASLPPAAPPTLSLVAADSAAGAGRAVRVLWAASPGADEDTTYVVVRKAGSAPRDIRDGTVIAGAGATEALDPNPPVAEQIWYAVAARRGGEPSPLTTATITLLPPVADVVVSSDPTSVTVRWTTPREAARITVTRTDPDGRRTAVPVTGTDIVTSTGLRTSQTYTFELIAEYHSGASTLTSAPVRVSAVPRLAASPVQSLEITPEGFGGERTDVVAEWTALVGHEVEIWQFPSAPGWASGSRVDHASLASSGGSRLQGTVRRLGTRVRLSASVPAGLRHYVAVTLDHRTALIGASTSLAICEPVGDPRVERFGEVAVVSWEWPRADYRVRANWTAGGRTGSTRVSRPEYVRDGGMRLTVGAGAATIRLASVLESAQGQWHSPEIVLELAGSSQSARYRLLWPRKLVGRGPLRIEFTADRPVRGVAVAVHLFAGAYLPQRATPETVVQRVDLDIPAPEPQIVEVDLPKLPKPFWVRCFAAKPDVLTLTDPPSDTLKGR